MREVTMYFAYDDTEFENREDCVKYEEYAEDMLREIVGSVSFLNRDNALYLTKGKDINTTLGKIANACDNCETIIVTKQLSSSARVFILNELCIELPEMPGKYKYNRKYYEWRVV